MRGCLDACQRLRDPGPEAGAGKEGEVSMSSAAVSGAGVSAGCHARRMLGSVLSALAALAVMGCAATPPDLAPGRAGPEPAAPISEVSPEALPEARSRTLEIDLAAQGFRYVEDERLVRAGAISAGSPEHPTPTGHFKVLNKDKDKVSGSYTNAYDMPTPMPYAMQFYGPYFIHEGWLPGYADSHGCVRLHYEDARFLFERMKRGDAVIITDPAGSGSWLRTDATGTASGDPSGGWLTADDPRRRWPHAGAGH